MKSATNNIFVTLGVVFVILLLAGTYFYVTDPMNLKPVISGTAGAESQGDTTSTTSTTANGFQLSEAQKQALLGAGLDPAKIPSSVNATQETCFVAALGNARVAEIKAGAVPSAVEFIKAKSCI